MNKIIEIKDLSSHYKGNIGHFKESQIWLKTDKFGLSDDSSDTWQLWLKRVNLF